MLYKKPKCKECEKECAMAYGIEKNTAFLCEKCWDFFLRTEKKKVNK